MVNWYVSREKFFKKFERIQNLHIFFLLPIREVPVVAELLGDLIILSPPEIVDFVLAPDANGTSVGVSTVCARLKEAIDGGWGTPFSALGTD